MRRTVKLHILAVVLIAAAGSILYCNTLDNDFIYNDHQMVAENTFIRSMENLRHFFSDKYFIGSREATYRPLVTLTFLVDYALWGDDPFGYHLTNLIFHILNGILFYFLLAIYIPSFDQRSFAANGNKGLFKNLTVPLLAALFFISHPVETEGVVSVGSRHDMVMTFFYFAAIILYLKTRMSSGKIRVLFYSFSLVSYFLSVLAKEMGLTLPAMIVLMDMFAPGEDLHGFKNRLKVIVKNMRFYWGFALVLILYLYVRFFGVAHPVETVGEYYSVSNLFGGTYYTHFLTVARIMGVYLRLMFFPLRLSLEYPVSPSFSILAPGEFFSILALLGVVFFALRCRNRYPLLFLGWAWFFVTLIPVSNIFILLISTRMSERFLYLPAAGYAMFLAAALYIMFQSGRNRWVRGTVIFAAGTILCLYSVRTVNRNMDWQDSRTFWESAAKTEYKSFRTHNNLAMVYYYEGETDKAIEELEIALRLANNAQTLINLGFIYFERGEYEKAAEKFRTAINTQPEYGPAYYHLALIHIKDGQDDRALELLEKALENTDKSRERPFYADIFNAMGKVLARKGQHDRAIEKYKMVLDLKPDYADARYDLAGLYFAKGMYDRAEKEYMDVLLVSPGHPGSIRGLGSIYLKLGLYDKAVEVCRNGLEAEPDNIEIRYVLAKAYLRKRLPDEAEAQYLEILKADPSHAYSRNNLANIYLSRGSVDKAAEEYEKVLAIDPSHLQARNNLANIYLSRKLYDSAIAEYRKVLDAAPENAIVHYNLGLAYEGKGSLTEAERHWREALRIDPELRPARDAIAGLRQEQTGADPDQRQKTKDLK